MVFLFLCEKLLWVLIRSALVRHFKWIPHHAFSWGNKKNIYMYLDTPQALLSRVLSRPLDTYSVFLPNQLFRWLKQLFIGRSGISVWRIHVKYHLFFFETHWHLFMEINLKISLTEKLEKFLTANFKSDYYQINNPSPESRYTLHVPLALPAV